MESAPSVAALCLPLLLCLSLFTSVQAATVPQEGAVRLVGSIEANKGRVEVYHNEEWGTVCDDQWDKNDARVVCRQLGYSGVQAVHAGATFGRGEGPIHFDELNCNGHEERLIDCSHDGVGVHDCYHSEDAGVACNSTPAGEQLPNSKTPLDTKTASNHYMLQSLAIPLAVSTEATSREALTLGGATVSAMQNTNRSQIAMTTVADTIATGLTASVSVASTEIAPVRATDISSKAPIETSTKLSTETSTEIATKISTETSTITTTATSTETVTETSTATSVHTSTATTTETATETSTKTFMETSTETVSVSFTATTTQTTTETSTETSLETSTETVSVSFTETTTETATGTSMKTSTETVSETITATTTETSTETSIETSTEISIESIIATVTELTPTMVAVTETKLILQNVTVTSTLSNAKADAISSPCAYPLPEFVYDSAQDVLPTGSTPFEIAAVMAVVLAFLLLVQLTACTVALVVCSKRKKRTQDDRVTLDSCIQMIEVNVAEEDKEENTGEHLSEQCVHGAPLN